MPRKITSHAHRLIVGKLLREARHAAGLNQQALARKLGKPHSFVSRYETGERRLDILELRHVCEACGVSLPQFVKKLDVALRS